MKVLLHPFSMETRLRDGVQILAYRVDVQGTNRHETSDAADIITHNNNTRHDRFAIARGAIA